MIEPLRDTLLVERVAQPETSDGGVVIPQEARDNLKSEFFVIAVGPGKRLPNGKIVPLDIQPKDIVVANTYAGQEVQWKTRRFRLIPYEAVLARVVQHDTTQKVTS